MDTVNDFKGITLLVTHYNRSHSLERLLDNFKSLHCHFEDIVVSDDGSQPEHLSKLKDLQKDFPFRLITTHKNKGLGHNLNKGQDAVRTPFTLYVQEDFIPKPLFPLRLRESYAFLQEREDLDIVRYYAYFKYPYLKPFRSGFSEILFSPWPWYWGYRKFYVYSDHPHLRRSSFFQKFGRYAEGIKPDMTEYKMMMSFLTKRGKALFYDDFKALFDQKNSEAEPSTIKRKYWQESSNMAVTAVRNLYRHLKFNLDYHFNSWGHTSQHSTSLRGDVVLSKEQ